jgi:hypothetical protein
MVKNSHFHFKHHDGMIVAYLPKEKMLLPADGYNPGAANATPPNPPSPYTVSLVRLQAGQHAGRVPRKRARPFSFPVRPTAAYCGRRNSPPYTALPRMCPCIALNTFARVSKASAVGWTSIVVSSA